MIRFFVGIDPGKKGAIAVLARDGLPMAIESLPYLDRAVDVPSLQAWMNLWAPECQVTIERQGHRGGQAGVYTILTNYGRLMATMEMEGIRFKEVTPAVWNKDLGIDPGKIGKEKKEASFAVARRIWGRDFDGLGLRPTEDGKVEALLIAYWGWQRRSTT